MTKAHATCQMVEFSAEKRQNSDCQTVDFIILDGRIAAESPSEIRVKIVKSYIAVSIDGALA